MGLLTRWDERWVKQHWTAGWPVHTVRPHPFLQRTPVQRGHLLSGATLCAALCVSVWSGQRTGMYDLTEQEKKMCLWKSRRTKALQWWMLEDSAGDLRCLGGERGPTSFTECVELFSLFAPSTERAPLFTRFHQRAPGAGSTQSYISSYYVFLMICFCRPCCTRWWSTENLTMDERQKSVSFCQRGFILLTSASPSCSPHRNQTHFWAFILFYFFLKKKKDKGLKKHSALLKHPDHRDVTGRE